MMLTFIGALLLGCGTGMMLMSSMVLLQQYFNRRRALAVSISSIGFSVGGVTFGPLTAKLLEVYALRGTLLIIGAIFFQTSLFSSLFRPAPGHSHVVTNDKTKSVSSSHGKEETVLIVDNIDSDASLKLQQKNKLSAGQSLSDAENNNERARSRAMRALLWVSQLFTDLFDFSLLKSFTFQLFIVATFCLFVGYSSFVLHTPSRADHFGIDSQSISMLPVFLCCATAISRLVSGFIAHSQCSSLILQFAIAVTVSGILQITTWLATSFVTIALYCILHGLINGL